SGALDLGTALNEIKPLLTSAKSPYLLHVGSGTPAMGTRATAELLKRLPKGTRYVGVGVGKRWNRAFMQIAAEKTGGYFTQVNPDESISWRGLELASTLYTPRLLDVSIKDGDGKVTFLPMVRLAAQGEEVVGICRVDDDEELPASVRISGTVGGKQIVRDLPVKNATQKAAYLPRAWARLEIDRLLAEDAKKNKEAVIALSKDFYVMTPFTSLLVLENDDMYDRFKVSRDRKDAWAMYAAPKKIKVVTEPLEGDQGDAEKGIRPSRKYVRGTIVTRSVPAILSTPSLWYSLGTDNLGVGGGLLGGAVGRGGLPASRSPAPGMTRGRPKRQSDDAPLAAAPPARGKEADSPADELKPAQGRDPLSGEPAPVPVAEE